MDDDNLQRPLLDSAEGGSAAGERDTSGLQQSAPSSADAANKPFAAAAAAQPRNEDSSAGEAALDSPSTAAYLMLGNNSAAPATTAAGLGPGETPAAAAIGYPAAHVTGMPTAAAHPSLPPRLVLHPLPDPLQLLQLPDLPDPRPEWQRLRGRMVCLLVLSILTAVVPGVLTIMASLVGTFAALVYFCPRMLGSTANPLWDGARTVRVCTLTGAILSALSVGLFSMFLLGLGLSSTIEAEEEEAYHEGQKELVVLLALISAWHGSVLWLNVSITRAARRVLQMSNPVSAGLYVL